MLQTVMLVEILVRLVKLLHLIFGESLKFLSQMVDFIRVIRPAVVFR